jgi:hypothetical protein
MLLMGDAPVPPSWPLIWMTSAFALATPDATTPMPASATSLTDTWCVHAVAVASAVGVHRAAEACARHAWRVRRSAPVRGAGGLPVRGARLWAAAAAARPPRTLAAGLIMCRS